MYRLASIFIVENLVVEKEGKEEELLNARSAVTKALKLEMTELNLIQHIVGHLELQIQDYVEVRNPSSRAQLLQVLSQFEERYSAKKTQGPSKNYNRKRRYWDVRRKSSYDRRNRNWRDVEGLDRQNDSTHFKFKYPKNGQRGNAPIVMVRRRLRCQARRHQNIRDLRAPYEVRRKSSLLYYTCDTPRPGVSSMRPRFVGINN
ncbi:hypothetical protein TNCV_5082701 [Trichonephila clavipes]|nr:hypothetical protein TNCV_5082701 [Trichonephila clavipes]